MHKFIHNNNMCFVAMVQSHIRRKLLADKYKDQIQNAKGDCCDVFTDVGNKYLSGNCFSYENTTFNNNNLVFINKDLNSNWYSTIN